MNQKVGEIESTHQEVVQQLIGIPDVTPEQLADSENHLRDLQRNADALDTNRQQIQSDKQREMERTTWFSELRAAEERNEELLNQQTEVAMLEAELEQANRANHLRPEKQAFDTTKSELREAEVALRQTEMELVDAQKQFDANRTDFDEKDNAYVTALVQYNREANDYNVARLEVRQATDRFTRAAELEEDLLELSARIESLSTELTEDNERYAALETEVRTIENLFGGQSVSTGSPRTPDFC